MIAFQRVGVRYPRSRSLAVSDVSFDAQPGRVTAVAGPNGSGKSTLVRALLRRVPMTSGRIVVDGEDVAAIDARRMARLVAVVPQREEPLFPSRVRESVALGRHPLRGAWAAETAADRAAVEEALARAGVAELADRRTDELSGGEWQRVRLARALAQHARALVMDEPTTFLDVAHEMEVFELLAALAADGHAVLVVSHQLNLVARFADSVILLSEGAVAAVGAPADVMRAPVLERVYRWPLVVTRDAATGAPSLVPLRRPAPGASAVPAPTA